MRNIEIMFADGMIGNKSVLLALSTLTTGNINSKLKKDAAPYKMQDVLPSAHEYIIPPLTEEEKAEQRNRQLLGFMATSKGVPKSFLEKIS
jgi:hypothetical protein